MSIKVKDFKIILILGSIKRSIDKLKNVLKSSKIYILYLKSFINVLQRYESIKSYNIY